MANLYGNTTRLFSTPYITVAEYKQAPTAIDYNNLVVGSTDPAVQDAELANNIARASSWIDSYCKQVIGATVETEQQRSRMRPDGTITVHPRYSPISVLTAFSYGTMPNQIQAYLDPSQGWIEDQQFILPYTASTGAFSSEGPLQFGLPASPSARVYCKYTYVAGYPNTILSANASQGATSIVLNNAVGLLSGTILNIYDGVNSEQIVVSTNDTYGDTTVVLDTPLLHAHTAGVSVSALPPAVKEAAILATTAFLKVRGDYSLTMGVTNQVGTVGLNTNQLEYDLMLAKELLEPFRRVR